jgi:hypothetical protein
MVAYGQNAVEEIRSAMPEFANVRQDFLLYDTIRIGENVPANVNGWFPDFTTMLSSGDGFSFFDQRQESEAGTSYTNMKKKTGLDWPIIITDMGIKFHYPDPVNVDMFDGDRASAKMFTQEVPTHSNCALFTGGGDDKLLTFLPEMAPYGFGVQGHQSGPVESYSSLLTNGVPVAGNRFQFANMAIALPKDISISIKLNIAKQGRDILALMAAVQPIVFANGTLTNEAEIRICIRGMREIQQVGNYTR